MNSTESSPLTVPGVATSLLSSPSSPSHPASSSVAQSAPAGHSLLHKHAAERERSHSSLNHPPQADVAVSSVAVGSQQDEQEEEEQQEQEARSSSWRAPVGVEDDVLCGDAGVSDEHAASGAADMDNVTTDEDMNEERLVMDSAGFVSARQHRAGSSVTRSFLRGDVVWDKGDWRRAEVGGTVGRG